MNFGGGAFAIMQAINCTQEKAEEIIRNYEKGFKGTAEFARKGTIELKKNGYVLINPITGHKMWWWDFQQWKERQASFDSDFWEKYKAFHKGTGDSVEMTVKMHFKAVSKWSRMVRNAPTQGELVALVKLLKFGEL